MGINAFLPLGLVNLEFWRNIKLWKGKKKKSLIPKKGHTYLVRKNKKEHGLNVLAEAIFQSREGLCVTAADSKSIKKYKFKGTKIIPLNPKELDELCLVLEYFIKNSNGGVVLLDDFEGVIENNPMERTTSFVSKLCTVVLSSNSSLIISLDRKKVADEVIRNLERVLATSCFNTMMNALSNPIRRGILDNLAKNEKMSFTSLMENLGLADIPPKLTFHLNVLKDLGIIEQNDARLYLLSDFGKTIVGLSDGFEKIIIAQIHTLDEV